MKLLGDSGMKMARAGFSFYFEKKIAKDLIERGFVEEVM